jgi:F-type H+-transporting ATPase subunit epsilon
MQIDIITPDHLIFSGEAVSATFPGTDGSFQVLNNHAALISTLDRGKIVLKTAEGEKNWEVDGGVVEVLNNKITVLAEAVLS